MKVISESKKVKQTPRRAPQPSKTLMRHAVKQPGVLRAETHTGRHSRLAKRPGASIAPKHSVNQVEASRLLHARTVKKSHAISRFSNTVFDYRSTLTAISSAERPKVAAPERPTVTSAHPTTGLLERAIQRADSHHQTRQHPRRHFSRRISSVAASSLAVLLLASFFAYQNAASIAIHRATGKVGFAASLPGYHPSGFSLGRAIYSNGYFQINFKSNSDQRSFAVVERPSAITSQPFSIDSRHNATWINNNVAYQVETNGSLSDEQLQRLADSL